MISPLKIGVVGVGHLGQHHVRLYRDMPGAQFVGAFDADSKKSNFPTLDALADAVEP